MGAYAFAPLHGYVQNLAGFIFPHPDTPKTLPILDPNLRRGTFWGRMQYAPTRIRQKRTRFHYPQLRVCEKRTRFHISAHGYTKNAPHFTLSNKDTPKTHPISDPNHRRGAFRGVCNTPLHRYTQNRPGFRRKPLSRDISGRMLLRPYTGTCKI